MYSSGDERKGGPTKHQRKNASVKTAALKAELKQLLAQPLVARGVSTRYITSGSRPIVDDVISGTCEFSWTSHRSLFYCIPDLTTLCRPRTDGRPEEVAGRGGCVTRQTSQGQARAAGVDWYKYRVNTPAVICVVFSTCTPVYVQAICVLRLP